MSELEETVTTRITAAEPDVEVLLVERLRGDWLRVTIDTPGGVGTDLCERVTGHLRDYLEDYTVEVSSPGPERPLARPEHYRRAVGSTVRVRTNERLDGRRSFTGTLVDADEASISLQTGEGPLTIPHERIHRSNVVPEGGSR